MDEDNSDAPRVTRARTRRLSALDTDSRPLTPIVDLTADRASPRPMRRTRLNSTTIDLRTPTRSTRLSVARGETPEPATPTAVKRATRTPAKSVRKVLPLPEAVNEEESSDQKVEAQSKTVSNNVHKKVLAEVAEDVLVDSTCTSPVRSASATDSQFATPPDDMRVTRSMSKSPPFLKRAVNNTPQQQSDMKSSPENKPKQTEESLEVATVIEDSPPVKAHTALKSDEGLTEAPITSTLVENQPMAMATSKVKVKVKDILVEIQETATVNKDPKADEEPNESIANEADDIKSGKKEQNDNEEEIMPAQSADATDKSHTANETVSSASIESVVPSVVPSDDAGCADGMVTEDIRLPDLTPNIKSRLVEPKEVEPIKMVSFNNNELDEAVKSKYPKTPARINATQGEIFSISENKAKSNTPLKPIILKGRNSSTPLAKLEPVLSQVDASSESTKPPPKIDMIRPFSELEDKASVVLTEEKPERVLVSKDADDKDEDDEEEEEEMPSMCEFVDNEVEVIENYQSGDSMDSSERREIEDNEIPHDGESVGSQDTTDEHSEDSTDEKMSFIVSDNEDCADIDDVDDNVDDDDDDSKIESLCFSSGTEEEPVDAKEHKKRRRIIVHDSSDDEEQKKPELTNGKDTEETETDTAKEIIEAKNVSGLKQDATKLPNNKAVKSLHLSVCEKSSESKPTKSVSLNKTAPALSTSVGEDSHKDATLEVGKVLDNSNECDKAEATKNMSSNNKSIYEVSDSDEESSSEHIEECILDEQAPGDQEQLTTECELQNTIDKGDLLKETSMAIDAKNTSKSQGSTSDGEDEVLEDKPVAPTSESSAFHMKQKREEEAMLLSELSSCDLSHLQQMFNPLQKSRRQTLYVQDPQIIGKEPKLKRRSEQLSSDVNPSQSFIETLAEEKRQQRKRKRLSKSFCGAVYDGLDTSVLPEVQHKKAKTDSDDISAADGSEVDELDTADKMDTPASTTAPTTDPATASATSPTTAPTTSPKTVLEVQPNEQHKEKVAQPKSRSEYLEYCDVLIEAANAAKLEQKKQRNAASKNQRKAASTTAVKPVNGAPITIVTANSEPNKPTKIKKNVKRLQATKQAVKHAMQLLVPDSASKEHQSLARKLSPQPEINAKSVKVKRQSKKTKQTQVSPVKSSDEENHHEPKRIKNSAGYVTVANKRKERLPIETFKISSGYVKVEPSTPTQKYFKEIPATPTNRNGFKEVPTTPKTSKKKVASVRNPATEAALRFKREMFGRSSK